MSVTSVKECKGTASAVEWVLRDVGHGMKPGADAQVCSALTLTSLLSFYSPFSKPRASSASSLISTSSCSMGSVWAQKVSPPATSVPFLWERLENTLSSVKVYALGGEEMGAGKEGGQTHCISLALI